VPGMGTGLEVKVLRGVSWKQPRVESNCTPGSRRETPDSGAVRPCGEEAVNELQHRTRVNVRASRYGRVSVSRNAKPKIQPGPYKVRGAAAAGHPVFLPREVCEGPRER
jgi:hypothetical protein